VKLLRVLQEREFEPVGSSQSVRVNVRIIAATNRHLEEAVSQGRFRRDLFYRLNVLPIHLPALRERVGDIPLLVAFFVQAFAKRSGKTISEIPEGAMQRLLAYSWPGNIRELQNVIERAVVLSSGNTLNLSGDFQDATASRVPSSEAAQNDPPFSIFPPARAPSRVNSAEPLKEVERRHIESVLTQTHWMIEGERGAARILNLNPSTLRSRMQKLGITRPHHS
jgi:transcriptional regulator with GAF, ATPase, and Fis domain